MQKREPKKSTPAMAVPLPGKQKERKEYRRKKNIHSQIITSEL